MAEPLTATEASRRFSQMLDRVRMHSESFDIVRNGVVVARVVPPEKAPPKVRDLSALLEALGPVDADFADDLEAIRGEQPPLEDPWAR